MNQILENIQVCSKIIITVLQSKWRSSNPANSGDPAMQLSISNIHVKNN